jgi:predicted nucleic acid-binding protein
LTIVDASVAVKWFFPEPGSEAARALLTHSAQLAAPALVRIEVSAAATRKVRLGEIAPQEARAACELWAGAIRKGVLALVPDVEVLSAAVELALKLAHPLQDCLYLALAQREQAALVTADPKFQARAQTMYSSVELLAGID